MFPSSLVVVLTGLLMLAVGLAVFAWAWRRGQFAALDQQSQVILDERDYRMERPWESAEQRAERRVQHGAPLDPARGEWGGAE